MKNLIKIMFALLMMVVACKKEDTPAPVLNTTNGTNGTNGADASVLYSDWISPGSGNTGTTGSNNTSGGENGNGTGSVGITQYFNVRAAAITQDILDKGLVMAYARLEGDSTTRALPTTTVSSGYLNIWNFALSVGQIQFTEFSGNLRIPTISNQNKFRYVIIPSTKHVRLSKPLKEMSYNEICDLFNIPK